MARAEGNARAVRRFGARLAPLEAFRQGAAIAAATKAILACGGALYALTPQVDHFKLSWKYGQPAKAFAIAGAAKPTNPGAATDKGGAPSLVGGWPTIEAMREAAKRQGMPGRQSRAIGLMADVTEWTLIELEPISFELSELWNRLEAELLEHRGAFGFLLAAVAVPGLLDAAWNFLRGLGLLCWLRARLDYLLIGLLKWHATGSAGVLQHYAALQRLMDSHGLPRQPKQNAREYLALIGRRYEHLLNDLDEMTSCFERAREGGGEIPGEELARVHRCYLRVCRAPGLEAVGFEARDGTP